MPAPKFSLTLAGAAPNQRASKEQLEDGINAGFDALWDHTEGVDQRLTAGQTALSRDLNDLDNRVSDLSSEMTDGIVGATTRAALLAMTKPAGTVGRVYQDSNAAYNGDYVSTGSGWTFVGADRIGKIEAAVGAPLASFRLPLIHDPWGVKSAGVQTVYVPRNILARLGETVLNAAYGTASTVFPAYIAISSSESSFTIYLDLLDTTNPVKVASYPTMPPNKRPDSILVIAEVYQRTIKTAYQVVRLENATSEFISFRWPIVVDGEKVRFGPFYHYSPTTLWTLYQPPAPAAYWEFDLNTAQASQWRYYFDREAAEKGQTPIKVADGGTTRPLVIDGSGVFLEIGTSINQIFATSHPVIGDNSGVPNLLPLGNDPDRAPRYDTTLTTSVTLTDSALIAMGLTKGFGGSRPMPRIQLPADTPTKGWMFIRVAVQVDTDNDFAAPSVYLQAGDGRNLAVFTMLMEKRLSARAAIYTRIVPYDVTETPAMLTAGYVGTGRVTAGHQYYAGPVKGAIRTGDFAGAGADDILFPPQIFVVTGRELPIFRSGVVPDRDGDTKLALYDEGASADVPFMQDVASQASFGSRASFKMGISGVRGRPAFRATQDVAVTRKTLPISGAIRVLAIGDSITNRELPSRIYTKLAGFGATPTMVGTMANDGGRSGEGRGSWEFADFIGMDTQFPAVPIGQESAYLAKPADNGNESGRWASNPFLRPSTGSDPAANIFNGLVFDFPNYLSRFGVSAPGFVTLQLGTNDINLKTPAVALDQITRGLAIMVPSILATNSTIRVGVGIPVLPRTQMGNGKWPSHMVTAVRAIMAECAKHARADVVPVWAHMSPDVGWPIASRYTSGGRIVGDVSDELHPTDVNRSLMAEAWAQWIACRS